MANRPNRPSIDALLARVDAIAAADADWRGGRLWNLVYYVDDDVDRLVREVSARFLVQNGVSPFAFPSARVFEREIVAMLLGWLGGSPDANAGCVTSGGTESILLATLAAREEAGRRARPAERPVILLPTTAHPAWEKAAHYLGVGLRWFEVDAGFRADPESARRAIDPNVILLVASAPSYCHGAIDPIEALGAIAVEHEVPFHVDACLGGLVLPFLRRTGRPIPAFDLSVAGVTSLSADLHKYGFAPKGAAVLLYADPEMRRRQYFVSTEYPGGVYATPTLAGSRSMAPVAAAWAVLEYLGESGLTEIASALGRTADALRDGIDGIEGLRVLGAPSATVMAIEAERVPVFELAELLAADGWLVERQQKPPSLHITVTSPAQEACVPAFLDCLRRGVDRLSSGVAVGDKGLAPLYDFVATSRDRSRVRNLALDVLDGKL